MSASLPSSEAELSDHAASSDASWEGASSHEGSSSEDEAQRAEAAPRPKIKLKRGGHVRAHAPSGDGAEATSALEASAEIPHTQADTASPADASPAEAPAAGTKRKRPVKQLRAKPLSTALLSLVSAFKRRDPYQFFWEPVNADEVPGYRDVITHPMDLGTMERRIHGRYYTSMDMFQHDFLLVTQNAQLFNPPSSVYHTAAKRLESWGLRAIEREGQSAVDDDALPDADGTGAGRRTAARRRLRGDEAPDSDADDGSRSREGSQMPEARSTARIGSMRSTAPIPRIAGETRDMTVFRHTLIYAGIPASALTGKNACTLRARAKPKPRLGPPPFFLAAETAGSAAAAGASEDAEVPARVYAEDGSLDSEHLANVPEFLAQHMGSTALLRPSLESLRYLPLTHPQAGTPGQSEAGLSFPPVRAGHPDALYPATLARPARAETDWSHTFDGTSLPESEGDQPFTVPGAPQPLAIGGVEAAPLALPSTWPAPSAQSAQELSSPGGLRLNRRERELEQERDESNWTFFRPHLHRLLDAADVALYANLPAYLAATGENGTLRSYATVRGAALGNALREQLRSLPYRALGLPRTAQFVPRTSLQQLPAPLQLTMQGAHESERLVEAVYGGVQGHAWARSLAEFASGAARFAELAEPAPLDTPPEPVIKEEDGEPDASGGVVMDVSGEHSASESEELRGTPSSATPAAAPPPPPPQRVDALPTPLLEHVCHEVVDPATGGLLGTLARLGRPLQRMHIAPSAPAPEPRSDAGELESLLADSDGALARSLSAAASLPAGSETLPLNKVLELVSAPRPTSST